MKMIKMRARNLFSRIRLALNIIFGGVDSMVDVYIVMIIRGMRTLSQVPVQLRDAVEQGLKDLGLDGEGKPLE